MAPHPGASGTSTRPARPATPAAAGDGEESPMTALRQATEVVDPVPGAGAPHLPQQPDLVQLLTPEGERVEHPDYSLDVGDDELRGAVPRPRAGPPVGRRGHRAAAPGRARHLGLAARPGGRPGRRRPRAAPTATWPSRPTASTASPGPAGSTRCRSWACSAAWTTAAGTRRRPASTCTRSSSARSACTRPATRWACSATAPRTPSWPSSATARPARARSTRR